MDTLRLIARIQADYARCVDDGPLEHWPDFFVEDGFYKLTTDRDYRQGSEAGLVWGDSKAALHDRAEALKTSGQGARHRTRHMSGLPVIVSETQTETATETPFLVLRIPEDGPTAILGSGRYLDLWRMMGQHAKLVERIVVCDAPHIDPGLAAPL